MKGIEIISIAKKTYAIVFRSNVKVKNLQFFTDDDSPLQVGFHDRIKNTKLTPHVHQIKRAIKIAAIYETLYIEKGKIKVTLYTEKGEAFAKKILTKGDAILLMNGGHGVDFLKKSRIFQVKQGPYSSTVHSKLYLK